MNVESKLKILIVDADTLRRACLCRWLQRDARSITVAGDVYEAWSALERGSFDVVLCSAECAPLCRIIRGSAAHAGVYLLLMADPCRGLQAVTEAEADDLLALPLEQDGVRLRLRIAARTLELRSMVLEQDATLRRVVQKMGTAYSSIESDLQAASAIQLGLLPTVSEVHDAFCAEWLMLPSSFLTGDNLNYFMLQDRYLVFYQADVAGHGIPSALLSVTLSQLLSPQPGSPLVRFDSTRDMKKVVPPAEVIAELNRRFVAQEGSYFTMLYGVLDVETRSLRFCQAGHPSPLQVTCDRSVRTIGEGGFPVGLWPEMTYEETQATLHPGERLVLYSDGLLECTNPAGMRYSLDRLRDILSGHAERSIRETLRSIQQDLENWSRGGLLKDDISMLIIESR